MKRNVELLEQTMQHILDHPEQHDQVMFINPNHSCGTVACFAGWAGLLSGMSTTSIMIGPMYAIGAELLGLTDPEARSLFDPTNTRSMLELMVKDLVNGDELRYPTVYQDQLEQR